jgi:crotonobetainyl-CoA:carnitine CoA-transferase CaiB-like acyl-CoA transferase
LCRTIGEPERAEDPRFRDVVGRMRHQDALDALVAGWTRRWTADAAMHALQAAGVPAGAVRDIPSLLADPHLKARPFIVEVDHPEVGRRSVAGLPARFSAMPELHYTAAPCLGQHNEEVFRGLLHLPEPEYTRLVETGVIA